jgi:hypothetical protein
LFEFCLLDIVSYLKTENNYCASNKERRADRTDLWLMIVKNER